VKGALGQTISGRIGARVNVKGFTGKRELIIRSKNPAEPDRWLWKQSLRSERVMGIRTCAAGKI